MQKGTGTKKTFNTYYFEFQDKQTQDRYGGLHSQYWGRPKEYYFVLQDRQEYTVSSRNT